MLISICVITYKRPKGLRSLLEGINALTFTEMDTPSIEVIVIDNDVEGVAAEICQQVEPEFKWKLVSGVEPQKGITYARNLSISLTSDNADFIAMLDDDEIPEPFWLENLLKVQQEYCADVVTGPTLPFYPEGSTPKWVIKGGFFATPRFLTGDVRHVAFTNNVLVRAELLNGLSPVFDNRFALSGGEDSHLFLKLAKEGNKIVWANDAVVWDYVMPARTNLKWILFRGYRSWKDFSSHEKELYPSLSRQLVRFFKGLGLMAWGLTRLLPSLVFGKAAIANSLLLVFRGAGTIGGLLGLLYEEYTDINFSAEASELELQKESSPKSKKVFNDAAWTNKISN